MSTTELASHSIPPVYGGDVRQLPSTPAPDYSTEKPVYQTAEREFRIERVKEEQKPPPETPELSFEQQVVQELESEKNELLTLKAKMAETKRKAVLIKLPEVTRNKILGLVRAGVATVRDFVGDRSRVDDLEVFSKALKLEAKAQEEGKLMRDKGLSLEEARKQAEEKSYKTYDAYSGGQSINQPAVVIDEEHMANKSPLQEKYQTEEYKRQQEDQRKKQEESNRNQTTLKRQQQQLLDTLPTDQKDKLERLLNSQSVTIANFTDAKGNLLSPKQTESKILDLWAKHQQDLREFNGPAGKPIAARYYQPAAFGQALSIKAEQPAVSVTSPLPEKKPVTVTDITAQFADPQRQFEVRQLIESSGIGVGEIVNEDGTIPTPNVIRERIEAARVKRSAPVLNSIREDLKVAAKQMTAIEKPAAEVIKPSSEELAKEQAEKAKEESKKAQEQLRQSVLATTPPDKRALVEGWFSSGLATAATFTDINGAPLLPHQMEEKVKEIEMTQEGKWEALKRDIPEEGKIEGLPMPEGKETPEQKRMRVENLLLNRFASDLVGVNGTPTPDAKAQNIMWTQWLVVRKALTTGTLTTEEVYNGSKEPLPLSELYKIVQSKKTTP